MCGPLRNVHLAAQDFVKQDETQCQIAVAKAISNIDMTSERNVRIPLVF